MTKYITPESVIRQIKADWEPKDSAHPMTLTLDQIVESLKVIAPEDVPRWINADDELPEIKEHYVSDTVIVRTRCGCYAFTELQEAAVGGYVFGVERMHPDDEDMEVTHWMKLPEPPKEEDDG